MPRFNLPADIPKEIGVLLLSAEFPGLTFTVTNYLSSGKSGCPNHSPRAIKTALPLIARYRFSVNQAATRLKSSLFYGRE
jgi:hypothetical protein